MDWFIGVIAMGDFGFDVAIVGGGVVGLAVLHELVSAGRSAVLFERLGGVGRETSSRNSEVIHGGMYYAPGTLKARLSVTGRRRLYEFARRHNVPFRRTGKVIVAVEEDEVAGLERIYQTGLENEVEGLRMLTGNGVAILAPGCKAVAGLHSAETGVVNAHGFMDALLRASEEMGGEVVCGAEVSGLRMIPGGWEVRYRDTDGEAEIASRMVVNCAGLRAQRVMALAGVDVENAGLRLRPCKGSYFAVGGESRKRIGGLVYPAPEANLAGLGIHTLVDFGGGVKLGPNVEYIDEADEYDYSVDAELQGLFFERAARYLPFLKKEDIGPDMSGVRPKLSGPGEAARDFYIGHEAGRGLYGFVNLAGIESPGLTASLAIGDMVSKMAVDIL